MQLQGTKVDGEIFYSIPARVCVDRSGVQSKFSAFQNDGFMTCILSAYFSDMLDRKIGETGIVV